MSIMDDQLVFMESAAITGSAAANVISTNNIKIPQGVDPKSGSAVNLRHFANGKMYVNIVVEDAALVASGGSATVTPRVYEHTAAITASNLASAAQVIEFPAITVDASGANYPDGKRIGSMPLPPAQRKPFLALVFAIATKKVSAGKVTAWIGPPAQQGT